MTAREAPVTDRANRTFERANRSMPSASRSRRMLSGREERYVTAMSKAFWQNAELTPSGRMDFSSCRICGSFLSSFTTCKKTDGSSASLRISRFTSTVKTLCICCRAACFSLFGLPYRKTLFVTSGWKLLSFLRRALGIVSSFFNTVWTGVRCIYGSFLRRHPRRSPHNRNGSTVRLSTVFREAWDTGHTVSAR